MDEKLMRDLIAAGVSRQLLRRQYGSLPRPKGITESDKEALAAAEAKRERRRQKRAQSADW